MDRQEVQQRLLAAMELASRRLMVETAAVAERERMARALVQMHLGRIARLPTSWPTC